MAKLKTIRLLGSMMLAVFVALSATPSYAADDSGKEFCWLDSYGRGVGTVPQQCASGKDRIGLLCYDKCGKNMKRFGFDCHSVCPKGMANQGLFCRATEYGRGLGYPWKFGDALNDNGMRSRCEKDHGKGNCQKQGFIFYPKCKSGYINIGLICRPKQPNCKALNLGGQFDLSCAKIVKIGNPVTGVCNSREQEDAGLCYKNCKSGYNGVGPVCWAKKPKGWVNCGMGAAKDSTTCASITFGQVAAVGEIALFIGSLGTSSAATGPAKATRLAKLKKDFEAMKKAFNAAKDGPKMKKAIQAAEAAGKVKKGYNASKTLDAAVTEEDMIRAAAQIAAIIDPSGVSSTVAAYTYPKCSKYFGPVKPNASTPAPKPGTTQTASLGDVKWAASAGRLPANAFIGGSEGSRKLAVCRAAYKGGTHPGKVVAGKCNIGWGGKEIVIGKFEVMTDKGVKLAWVKGRSAKGMIIGGSERGRSLPVCRAKYKSGTHPGKVVAGKCNIGWGGKEIVLSTFEVLVQR